MSDSFTNHHNIEKFYRDKGDIIQFFKERNQVREKNNVLRYYLYQFRKENYSFLAHFQYPNFRVYRKHIESVMATYPNTRKDLEENLETEFHLTKVKEFRYRDLNTDLYSIIRLQIENYRYFEEQILPRFEKIWEERVITTAIFTDHVNSNKLMLLCNWREEEDYFKFQLHDIHQRLIDQDPQVHEIKFEDTMERIYNWEAGGTA